jgi:D-psicose/D-tagatose/L-ribulose 3-epimerase
VKLSLCNEVIRELSFERQCALAAGLGYRGLELAPFTFGGDAWRMPAAKRAEIRKVCADNGLEVSGLHWLLAAPAGLSITSVDRAVWQKSVDVLRASVDLCAELGGGYLVHGSPAQRRVASPDDASRAEEAWMLAGEQAALAKVAYCIEPLAQPDCNFVNTLAEAAEIVRRIGWLPMSNSTIATGAVRGRATTGSRPSCRPCAKPAIAAGSPWSPSSMNPMGRLAPRA